MRLDRDEFVITYDSSNATENDLVDIITMSGYTSHIVVGEGETVPSEGDAGSRDDPIFVAALARAKEENKPLVLDFYADWCAPCLKMLKETIPDPQVAALLEKCIFLKVDTDEHPELARSFAVDGLPDIRFLAPDGTEIRRLRDYQNANDFAQALTTLLQEKGSQ